MIDDPIRDRSLLDYDAEISVGSKVARTDCLEEYDMFGPAVVLAMDGMQAPRPHRDSAWIKYRGDQEAHYWCYRSVDICDLVVVNDPEEPAS